MIVLGTRWHWDDVYSRIQKELTALTDDEKQGIQMDGEEAPLKWWIEKRKVVEEKKVIFPTRNGQFRFDTRYLRFHATRGFDGGSVRAPLQNLSPEEERELASRLEPLG